MTELERKAYAYVIERQKDPNYPVYNWETEITDAYEQGYKDAVDNACSGLTKIKENLLSSAKEGLWNDAQGDVLPEIDREVIVLCNNGKVCFGHRPNPDSYATVEGENFYPQTYDKGGWNIPDVRWWLDVSIPNLEEQQ